MMRDTANKFSPVTLSLHWLVGIMMICLLATGWYMAEFGFYPLYFWHKSFGVLIILFVVPRVIWRMKNGWPTPVSQYSALEITLAKCVHYLLIIGTLVMPISGFLMSALGGYGVSLFGLELVARRPDPADPQEVIPINAAIGGITHTIHHYAGYALIAGVALHIAGALKHHLVDKDGTLRRMLGSEV